MAKGWDNDDSPDSRTSFTSISEWWDDMIAVKPKEDKRRISGRFLYVLWNAWKERNRSDSVLLLASGQPSRLTLISPFLVSLVGSAMLPP
jgi:hypothetical protein